LLFFSVVNPTSAENIKEKWIAEVKSHCPNVPYFLIGTQTDQRDNQKILEELNERKQKPLKDKDGKKLAKEIEAVKYMECSSKTMSGYRDIFDEVLRYVINEHKQGKKLGKQCWSIDCRQKLAQLGKVKCQGRCHAFYCTDCMEFWEDGFKGCPQCAVYEREDREKRGKKGPTVKKSRKPPAERIAEKEEKERKKEEKLRKKMAKSKTEGKVEDGSEKGGSDKEKSESGDEKKPERGKSEEEPESSEPSEGDEKKKDERDESD